MSDEAHVNLMRAYAAEADCRIMYRALKHLFDEQDTSAPTEARDILTTFNTKYG